MSEKVKEQISNWIKKITTESFEIERASTDASFREYYRIIFSESSKIVMYAPPQKEGLRDFVKINEKMSMAKINVPKIYEIDEQQGLLLMTDFGKDTYLDVLNKETVFCLYTDAIDVIHIMQTNIQSDNLKDFDKEEQNKEVQIFTEWFLGNHMKIKKDDYASSGLSEALENVLDRINTIPKSFIHRDFHSRNLMVTKSRNPGVLDFQDAMLGPITYDLVSLLRDCYVSWEDDLIESMCKTFIQKMDSNKITQEEFFYWFDITGLQRHIKAIGIFCRLNYRDNKSNYIQDIPRTMNYVKKILDKYEEFHDLRSTFSDMRLI